jgi:carboxymethylenebutenolidase
MAQGTATRTTSREIMKRVHDEHVAAENRSDLDAALATYHDECFYENVPGGFRVVGGNEIRAYYTGLMAGIPDGTLDVEGEVFGDDVLVTWGTFRGTASGPLFGVEPTGRRIELPVVGRITFRDGLMEGEHLYYDVATLAAQAGIPIETALKALASLREMWPVRRG